MCVNVRDLLDRVEVGVGESRVDTPIETIIARDIGDIGGVSRTSTAGEQADNMSLPVNDNRPGIAGGGKQTALVTVRINGDLPRRTFDAISAIYVHERFESSPATNSDSGLIGLNDEKALLAVRIELLRFEHFFLATTLIWRRPPVGYLEGRPSSTFLGRIRRARSCCLDIIVKLDDHSNIDRNVPR